MNKSAFYAVFALCAMVFGARAAEVDKPLLAAKRSVPLTWCSLGTSISWYNNHVAPSFTKGYQTRVMEQIKFSGFVNRGVNAGCVSSAIGGVVKADFYTIEHGVNDWGNRVKPGTIDDYEKNTGTGTFAGGYRKVVDAIRTVNPQAKIVLCTPRKAYGFGSYLPATCDGQKDGGYYLKDYVEIVRAIAKKEGFIVADFYANCGEQDELASLSIDQALHPNDAGYQKMANELVKAILKQFPDAEEVKTGPAAFTDDGKPKSVKHEACLTSDPQVVLVGVDIAKVTVESAMMGGSWIPNGPFESAVRLLKRDGAAGKMTCQIQVRPPDNATRAIGLEFAQDGGDVTAKILWCRYSWDWPVGSDFTRDGHAGNVGVAASLDDAGYVVSSLTLGVNKPDLPSAVAGDVAPAEDAPIDDPSVKPGALAYNGNLLAKPKIVLKGVDLATVAVDSAMMCGAWIPGSPFESTVHFVKRDATAKKMTCQIQVRPPDNCTRCVCVEFAQQGPDVSAKILWARYSWDGPVGTDCDKPGYSGTAPIATSLEAIGYGISSLSFSPVRR